VEDGATGVEAYMNATAPMAEAPEAPAVPQIPGCLPQGYDENSMLTLPQFAIWRQISLKTARRRQAITPGLDRKSERDVRIHVKSYLARAIKR